MEILRKCTILCLLCLASSFTFGQYKIAYVDADEVIKAMPEYRVVKNELETFQKQLLKDLDEEKKSIAKFLYGSK